MRKYYDILKYKWYGTNQANMCPSIFQFFVNQTMDRDSEAYDKWHTFQLYSGIIKHCMCYFNSAINPIIYYFMSAQFKVRFSTEEYRS